MSMIDQAAKAICKDIYRGDFDKLSDGEPLKEVCRDMARSALSAIPFDAAGYIKNLEEFIESIGDASGPYPALDGMQIVADSRKVLK